MTRAMPTGCTGDAPDVVDAASPGPAVSSAGPLPTSAVPANAVVEQYGDLVEYGMSLGVDLDADGDEDLSWAVQQAFHAPLPGGWTEYMDDTGRAYYIKDGSTESTWEHPMDGVYRELLDLIKRQRSTSTPEAQREEVVKHHLKQVHERAKADLEAWSGPYPSEQGDYYYNDALRLSTWDSPCAQWEQELALRHTVLARYLLPEQVAAGGAFGGATATGAPNSHHLLQALRLQLGNLHFQSGGGSPSDAVPEPSTSRSFHTARSQGSSRSGRHKHSPSDGQHRDRKEKKHRHRRSSEERKAEREGRHLATVDQGQTYLEEPSATPYAS